LTNKLEAKANSEATNFMRSWKLKQKILRVRAESEANSKQWCSEAWHFKRSWKPKQKLFYCFHISGQKWSISVFL